MNFEFKKVTGTHMPHALQYTSAFNKIKIAAVLAAFCNEGQLGISWIFFGEEKDRCQGVLQESKASQR